MIQKTLTVAGSDSSGGAGLQADLKTFEEYGTFGFSVITCVVTMDPDEGWSHTVTPIASNLVEKQLKTVYAGGPVAAMKTAMTGSVETIETIRHYIDKFNQTNLVVDPVMACKGTSELLQPENVAAMKELLLPKALITTPNLTEAGILAEMEPLKTVEDMQLAAEKIRELGPQNVVIKGGKGIASDEAIDVLYDGKTHTLLKAEKIDTDFNHGAGCTFAAAITAGLAKGWSVDKAVRTAKDFVAAAIAQGVRINPYLGHVWHGAYTHAEKRFS